MLTLRLHERIHLTLCLLQLSLTLHKLSVQSFHTFSQSDFLLCEFFFHLYKFFVFAGETIFVSFETLLKTLCVLEGK